MNEKIFVVAGNHEQYNSWLKKHIDELYNKHPNLSVSLSNFVYVHGPEVFRGFNRVHGYFTGTYKDRNDIRDIVREIRRINNIDPSRQILPDVFVGRGLQTTTHKVLPTQTKPNQPHYVFMNGVIQPPNCYTVEVIGKEAYFRFDTAPPAGAFIQVQYGVDVNLLHGNGTTVVFPIKIPYSSI